MDSSYFWIKVEIFCMFFAPLFVLGVAMLMAQSLKLLGRSARQLWKTLR